MEELETTGLASGLARSIHSAGVRRRLSKEGLELWTSGLDVGVVLLEYQDALAVGISVLDRYSCTSRLVETLSSGQVC